jgi:hypothetical protein
VIIAVLRIRDVYPGSCFLSIPDPGSQIPDLTTVPKEEGEKKFVCPTVFSALNNI